MSKTFCESLGSDSRVSPDRRHPKASEHREAADFKLAFQGLERNIARPIMEQKVADLTFGERLFVWFDANKKQAAWGAGIAIVLGFVVYYYIWSQGVKEVRAGEALSQILANNLFSGSGKLGSPDEYLNVVKEYAGTPTAAQALLLAGGALFIEGEYVEAQSQFKKFTQEYPRNPLVSHALLGNASCLDAQGKVEEAERAYREALNRFPNASTTAQAKLGLARAYEVQGKPNEARPLYEELMRSESFSSFGNEAAFRLEALKANQPAVAPETPGITNAPAFQLTTPPSQ